MGELADMLATHGDDMGHGAQDGSEDPDHKAMAEASVKAFFEAGKKGDYAMATEHLASAMEHCESYGPEEPDGDMGEGPPHGGGHALLLVPRGGK